MLFNDAQLKFIEACASRCAELRTDELAVFALIESLRPEDAHLDDTQLAIIRFCSEECKRQDSGPLSVFWMITAYNLAHARYQERQGAIVEDDILEMLALIEPEKNARGYRRQNIHFKDGTVVPWQPIEQRMMRLVQFQDCRDAVEFYIEFEDIHPALDGNGRCGAILFNWKLATLLNPATPPRVNFKTRTVET